ncbi:hypothetical protein HYH03_012810 [Edaphochlamys debaryana]|uniref:Uncharacterized protein n=1 Tax=Edaphochlamys debaryana TaxID=47281 RepID=A0A835XPD7_9CHLO|nr:hypothetical protein HYH03_012810 [Edaphochlamys debaryana]|eukprot:KAG2488642.1 hypothetical protein HYH03_012810 [Edaphochlamys debaryana]
MRPCSLHAAPCRQLSAQRHVICTNRSAVPLSKARPAVTNFASNESEWAGASQAADINALKDFLGNKVATKEDLQALAAKVATKDALEALSAKVATKEDLKALATKEELKALATKEELKALATKEDLKALATKEDLKALFEKISTKENVTPWWIDKAMAGGVGMALGTALGAFLMAVLPSLMNSAK